MEAPKEEIKSQKYNAYDDEKMAEEDGFDV